MKRDLIKTERRDSNLARHAWIAFGGLLALGMIMITVRELPSMRREMRLMRM
jgi:hypothetical protein